jgi:hypothetical protein
MDACVSDGSTLPNGQIKLAVFDIDTQISSIQHINAFQFVPGPASSLIVGNGSEFDLMDLQLHAEQSLKCPAEQTVCAIFVPKSQSPSSDFALCSYPADDENCDFYRGRPAQKLQEANHTFDF